MIKRILIPVLLVFISACACPAERAAVERLEEQHEKLFSKYMVYVRADTKLDSKSKDDEEKLLKSLRDITEALKKALKE